MPNADSTNIEKLSEQVSGIDFRLHSVEGESDDHESDFERFTEKFKQVEARLDRLESGSVATAETDLEISFEVLHHVAEVKSTIEKSGLRGMDPDAADAIWRAVDSIQQLMEGPIELTTTH